MQEKKIILVLDENSLNSYLHTFVKKYHTFFRDLRIVHVGIKKWDAFSIGMNSTATDIYMPYVAPDSITDDNKREKLGNRIIDFLLLEKVIDESTQPVFLFNNAQLSFLTGTIKRRINATIIAYIDTLSWEYFAGKKYDEAAALFHSTTDETALRPLRNKEERTLCENADKIICHTPENSTFLSTVYHFKSAVCPQKGNTGIPHINRQQSAIRQDEKVLFFYYSNGQQDMLKMLFEAVEKSLPDHPTLKIIIAGKDYDYTIYNDINTAVLCRTILLGDRNMDEIASFIQIADVVITLPAKELKNTCCLNAVLYNKPLIITTWAAPQSLITKYREMIQLLPVHEITSDLLAVNIQHSLHHSIPGIKQELLPDTELIQYMETTDHPSVNKY
jgi:hypothetical protein